MDGEIFTSDIRKHVLKSDKGKKLLINVLKCTAWPSCDQNTLMVNNVRGVLPISGSFDLCIKDFTGQSFALE